MGVTGQGFPYVDGDDAITDYPAAMQLLAEEIDKRHQSVRVRKLAEALGAGGPQETMVFDQVTWADWAGAAAVANSNLYTPTAGRYRITAAFRFAGQSGSGNSYGGIQHYNAASVQYLANSRYAASPIINLGLVVSEIYECLAGDFFTFVALSGASGAGGTVDFFATAERLK